jgi:hypothetical protein
MNIQNPPATQLIVVAPLPAVKAPSFALVEADNGLTNPGGDRQPPQTTRTFETLATSTKRYSNLPADAYFSRSGTVLHNKVKHALNAYLSHQALPEQEERSKLHQMLSIDYYV